MRSLQLVACIETFLLDSHWTNAWPLTGISEPPWPIWARTNVHQYRKSFHTSQLLNSAWISTSISRAKDESFLRKQRFQKEREDGAGAAAGGAAGGGGKAGGRNGGRGGDG